VQRILRSIRAGGSVGMERSFSVHEADASRRQMQDARIFGRARGQIVNSVQAIEESSCCTPPSFLTDRKCQMTAAPSATTCLRCQGLRS
jgi:hypothetical protein